MSYQSLTRMLQLFFAVFVTYNITSLRYYIPETSFISQPDIKDDLVRKVSQDPEGNEIERTSLIVETDLIEIEPLTSQISKTNHALPGVNKTDEMQGKDYKLEHNIFRKLIERSNSIINICHGIPLIDRVEAVKDFHTGVPPLPEHGLLVALKNWVLKEDRGEASNTQNYQTCRLPPSTSCGTTFYSVIFMSHTISDRQRLRKMTNAIDDLALRPNTKEIILVWNAEREILTNSNSERVKKLMGWEQDTSHPLRIFYSLENGLQNSLMNRYHPSIQPVEEAIMYFDDDGPFFSEDVMDAGMQLWRLNSDTQVGCMPRNIRFTSKRMLLLQDNATRSAMKLYKENALEMRVSPYDSLTGREDFDDGKYPKFTPICGDTVEYNYFDFPHFQAHMFIPSGTILHRNFMCFIWHPVFKELRQYIHDHPTHPDDMMVSTMVSHLSGRILRTFPREIKNAKTSNKKQRKQRENADSAVHQPASSRRKLLWRQKNWAEMREEAINSILNYFGSINPGSVGWCVGTQYEVRQKNRRGQFSYNCKPEFPDLDLKQIPWMNEGISGYDHFQ